MLSFLINSKRQPVVGILGNATFQPDHPITMNYIYSSYVKWLEQSGIRWIPLLIRDTDDETNAKLERLDGVLLTGGSDSFGTKAKPSPYLKKIKQIMDFAVQKNDSGASFSVFGTCNGFESMLTVLSDHSMEVSSTPDSNITRSVDLTETAYNSYLTLSFTKKDLEGLKDKEVFFYHHDNGFPMKRVLENEYVKNNIDVLGSTTNSSGLEYLAIYQHKRYPFLSTQFHTEKVQFIYKDEYKINKSDYAIQMNMRFSRVFKKMLGDNKTNMSNEEVLGYRKDVVLEFGFSTEEESYNFYEKKGRDMLVVDQGVL